MPDPSAFLDRNYRYVVVGASADPHKYGHIVFKDLRSAGLTVIPVNPKLSEIDGVPAAAAAEQVNPLPDVVISVVLPTIGLGVLERAAAAGLKKFWFQPGAESEEIRQRAKELGLDAMADGSCIMAARRAAGVKKEPQ